MSEWAPQSAAGVLTASKEAKWDPKAGAERKGTTNAAHIVVYDRSSKRLVEETISPNIILAMRQIYQSKARALPFLHGCEILCPERAIFLQCFHVGAPH